MNNVELVIVYTVLWWKM